MIWTINTGDDGRFHGTIPIYTAEGHRLATDRDLKSSKKIRKGLEKVGYAMDTVKGRAVLYLAAGSQLERLGIRIFPYRDTSSDREDLPPLRPIPRT